MALIAEATNKANSGRGEGRAFTMRMIHSYIVGIPLVCSAHLGIISTTGATDLSEPQRVVPQCPGDDLRAWPWVFGPPWQRVCQWG